MSKIQFIHLDTLGQIYTVAPKYNSYQIIEGSQLYAPNSYNITMQLQSPIYNAKRIYLKSFETALMFPNVRSTSNLNYIIVSCNGTEKRVILPDATYNNLTALCADLTTYAGIQFPSDGLTFTVSSSTNSGNIKVYSSVYSTVSVVYSNLAYMLGFRVGIDTLTTNNCYASYKANLAFDNLLHIYLPNIGNSNTSTNSGILSSFKILLTQTSGVVNFNSENLGFSQFITVSNPLTHISEISLCVFDRYGYSLNSWGADISLTLAIES